MPKVLLSATTSAKKSNYFYVIGSDIPAHFTCPGIAGTEKATLEKRAANGDSTQYKVDGVLQQISVDNTGVTVYSTGV